MAPDNTTMTQDKEMEQTLYLVDEIRSVSESADTHIANLVSIIEDLDSQLSEINSKLGEAEKLLTENNIPF